MKIFKRTTLLLLVLALLVISVVPVAAKAPMVTSAPEVALFTQEAAPGIDLDLTAFIKDAMIGVVPLIFIIMGLVEYFKKFKLKDGTQRFKGDTLLLISMVIGLLFGTGYMITQQRPPAGDVFTIYVYWFSTCVYGIASGLVASGAFDVIKGVIAKLGLTQKE